VLFLLRFYGNDFFKKLGKLILTDIPKSRLYVIPELVNNKPPLISPSIEPSIYLSTSPNCSGVPIPIVWESTPLVSKRVLDACSNRDLSYMLKGVGSHKCLSFSSVDSSSDPLVVRASKSYFYSSILIDPKFKSLI
jgi:hypothetical protein